MRFGGANKVGVSLARPAPLLGAEARSQCFDLSRFLGLLLGCIGDVVGPAFSSDDVVDAVETVVTTYVKLRADGERFLDTYRRVGAEPFKERLYPEKTDAAA